MTHDSMSGSAPGFDVRPARVHAGTDLVVRLPGLIALVRRSPGDEDNVGELLECLRTVSATTPHAPGTRLARQLSIWLGETETSPAFGTVAATEDGIAVFLHGAVSLASEDGDVAMSGSEAAFAVDRVLAAPDGDLLLAGDDAPVPAPSDLPAWAGLNSGVAIGGSVTLGGQSATSLIPSDQPPPAEIPEPAPTGPHRTEVSAEPAPLEPVAQEPAPRTATDLDAQTGAPGAVPIDVPVNEVPAAERPAEPEPVPDAPRSEPSPAPAAPVDHPAPRLSERIDVGTDSEPPRPPLPVAGSSPAPSSLERQAEAKEQGPSRPGAYVRGFRCSRGHLNDPRVSFCRLCGIRMDHVTGILTYERRPPLGLIVLDAGTSYVLDDNYIVGRTPETSDEVRSGAYRPIRIDDRSGSLSRVHAEIRLEDWDVLLIDRRSANGTFVAGPDGAGGHLPWTRLAPGQKFILTPGTQVQIGRRRFVFESSAARI